MSQAHYGEGRGRVRGPEERDRRAMGRESGPKTFLVVWGTLLGVLFGLGALTLALVFGAPLGGKIQAALGLVGLALGGLIAWTSVTLGWSLRPRGKTEVETRSSRRGKA